MKRLFSLMAMVLIAFSASGQFFKYARFSNFDESTTLVNGMMWVNPSTGLWQFRQNGVTVGLVGPSDYWKTSGLTELVGSTVIDADGNSLQITGADPFQIGGGTVQLSSTGGLTILSSAGTTITSQGEAIIESADALSITSSGIIGITSSDDMNIEATGGPVTLRSDETTTVLGGSALNTTGQTIIYNAASSGDRNLTFSNDGAIYQDAATNGNGGLRYGADYSGYASITDRYIPDRGWVKDGSATLTNKSMSGSSNTFTNIPLSTAVTGDLAYANLTPATAASRLLGRGSASSGDWQEITLGSGLSMSGTTLSATSVFSGSIASTQVAFGSGSNTISGDENFTYNSTNFSLRVFDVSPNQITFQSTLPTNVNGRMYYYSAGTNGFFMRRSDETLEIVGTTSLANQQIPFAAGNDKIVGEAAFTYNSGTNTQTILHPSNGSSTALAGGQIDVDNGTNTMTITGNGITNDGGINISAVEDLQLEATDLIIEIDGVVGNAGQALRKNAGNTSFEYFTPISGSISADQVAFGNGTNSITGNAGFRHTFTSNSNTVLIGRNTITDSNTTLSIQADNDTDDVSLSFYVNASGGDGQHNTISSSGLPLFISTSHASGGSTSGNNIVIEPNATGANYLILRSIPTSNPCGSAPSGTVWNNSGVLNICP